MRLISKISLGILALGFTSCVGNAEFSQYVRAHRLKQEAMAPDYKKYITNDQTIDEQLKQTKLGLLDAEDQMISNAEKALGLVPATPVAGGK